MPREQGIVKEVIGKNAVVRVMKSSACDHCGSRSSCHILSDREMVVEVANDLQARVGDNVELRVPSGSLLKLSLLVYFLPVALLVVGAYIGGAWAKSLDLQPTAASIVGAGLGMGIAFYLLRLYENVERARGEHRPRMTRILSSEVSYPQPDDSK